MNSAKTSRPHLRLLTFLRFIAALLVVILHISREIRQTLPVFLADFFRSGYHLVSFFFVLSGFVLAYVYSSERPEEDFREGVWQFWRSRIARIYPAYAFAFVLAAPAIIYNARFISGKTAVELAGEAVLVTSLLQSWIPSKAMAWNMAAWSLSVEAFLYLIFPWLARFLARQKLWPCLGMAWLVAILTTLVRLALISDSDPLGKDNLSMFAEHNPLFFIPHFAFGIILSRCFLFGSQSSRPPFDWLLITGLMLTAVLFMSRSVLPAWMTSDILFIPLFGMIIWGAAGTSSRIAGLFCSRPCVVLGEASYALYILHLPLLSYWPPGTRLLGLPTLQTWSGQLLFLVISAGFSVAVFYQIEKPARRWLLGRKNTPLRD